MTYPTKPKFLTDVAQHVMTVVRDDGVHRHLRFKRPDSSDMHFDLITWPGYLCYAGDIGTYVFSRTTDMFDFFRRSDDKASINPGYWAEKCQAADMCDGLTVYSSDLFRAAVLKILDYKKATPELRQEVEDEVLSCADDGEVLARNAINNFTFEGERYEPFEDFFEADLKVFTFRYVWCCYALVWGIKTYDAAQVPA